MEKEKLSDRPLNSQTQITLWGDKKIRIFNNLVKLEDITAMGLTKTGRIGFIELTFDDGNISIIHNPHTR